MFKELLTPDKDPMGAAIEEYYRTGKAGKLRVLSSMFEEDEMPIKHLFRTENDMSPIERKSLNLAKGRILDVGAGSGCHALTLQEQGKEVKAIDISPLSVLVMQERGVKDVVHQNFFSPQFTGQFDTILMLMNGSGIIGRINNLVLFFDKLKQILSPNGFLLMDSSDLRYLFENEDGSYDIDLNAGYYGEVDFRMKYRTVEGDSFDWLYIDPQTLEYYANESGFKSTIIMEGEHYDYLAKIELI